MDLSKFVNLTAHTINVEVGKDLISIPPSGSILRLEEYVEPRGRFNGVEVVKKVYSLKVDFSILSPDYYYLVSVIMLPYIKEKEFKLHSLTFLAPDTGEGSVIRDDKGRIVAVRRFLCV